MHPTAKRRGADAVFKAWEEVHERFTKNNGDDNTSKIILGLLTYIQELERDEEGDG